MRLKLILLTALAALTATGAAVAGNDNGNGQARGHGRAALYVFVGKLTATPSNGGVSITVEGGNRLALRSMLGQPITQTFAYGDRTEFLKWSKGVPTVVQPSDLAAGDYVRVNVRAPRGSSLDTIEHTNAGVIGDHGTELSRPDKPDYLFRGKVTAVGSSTVSLDVRGGNRRALRLLIGSPGTQTFTVGDSTIFLRWQGKVPTVVELADLKAGDSVAIHVRAQAGSSLSQVEATQAAKVAEHEPASKS